MLGPKGHYFRLARVSQARRKGKAVSRTDTRSTREEEEDKASPVLGSRGRAKWTRVNLGFRRQKPSGKRLLLIHLFYAKQEFILDPISPRVI